MNKFLSILMALIMLFSIAGGASAAPKGNGSGTIDPFNLEITALKGKEQTDLYINIQPKEEGYNAPELLKKVQLKSYDAETEELVYTRNYNKEISSPNGKGIIILNDVERYQPLKTMVHVKNDETRNEVIVEGKTQVLLRPDLIIDDIQSPEEVQPSTPFNVSAQLKEINTDVGANAKVELLHGDTVLDSIEDVSIAAGSEKGVVLLPSLEKPGTYTLTLRISGADPAEYETNNNEKTFTIEVVEPNKPIQYYSSYNYQEGESHYRYHNYYYGYYYDYGYSNENSWQGKWENFYLYGSTTEQVDPAGTFNVKFHNENGEQFNVHFDLNEVNYYGWNSKTSYSGYDPETGTYVSVYPYNGGTNIYLDHYAGDYVYSYKWQSWYDSYEYEGEYKYGKFINAKEKVGATIDLPGKDGVHHGGKLEYSLTPYQYSWDDRNYGWWNYYSESWGNMSGYRGWGSGFTTTK